MCSSPLFSREDLLYLFLMYLVQTLLSNFCAFLLLSLNPKQLCMSLTRDICNFIISEENL